MTDKEKVRTIMKHIRRVEDNCIMLGYKLMDNGNFDLGMALIIRGREHDLSKLNSQYEFKHLVLNDEEFTHALRVHQQSNRHHPEYYISKGNSIHDMYKVDIAEMVCDCCARGQEFGTDIKKWFEEEATVKYNFKMTDNTGKLITLYLDLLLTPKFESIRNGN